MVRAPRLNWFHDRLDSDTPVFLATDSSLVLADLTDIYADLRFTPKWYPAEGSGSLHQNPACPDRAENAAEALVDIWLLSMCRSLLICKGFFGETARRLSPSTPSEEFPNRIHPTLAEKLADGWTNPI
jgi:hypothetical protein